MKNIDTSYYQRIYLLSTDASATILDKLELNKEYFIFFLKGKKYR